MTTDKLFVLLLVILLPLTGCLDIADTAEAEDSDEENTSTTMPMIYSLQIQPNQEHNITLYGDSTLKLEQAYSGVTDPDCSSDCIMSWTFTNQIPMTVDCTSGFIADTILYRDYFVPAIGGESCVVVFTATNYPIVAHFSEASLSAL